MAKVFITGIAGFLGSHLADAMIADGHHVVGVDNMVGGERDNIPYDADFYFADCNDIDRIRDVSAGSEIVYHCAATPHEGLSVFSPHLITKNIFGASISVFSAAIANRAKRIVFCSSMARYGAILTPFREYQKPVPQDPYGISKLACEYILRNLCTAHGIEYAVVVPHNIIGPRQKYDDPFRNVAAIMINMMLQGRQPIIYGSGKQERCFSFVDDCIYCLRKIAFHSDMNGEVVNIGPDEEPVTILELAERIAWQLDFKLNPVFVDDRPQEVKSAICSSDKARRLLDYKTTVNLDDGLAKMIEWIRERGTKQFKYHLDLEIVNEKTPRTWRERLF